MEEFKESKLENKSITFKELIANSKNFLKQIGQNNYPVQTNTIESLVEKHIKPEQFVRKANQTYPIMHTSVQALIEQFLSYKKTNGSKIEKNFYQNMSVEKFLDRLLQKRPLVFISVADNYKLRDSTVGFDGFQAIGTEAEKSPLLLADYLSYDEMQISALMGVSTDTFFINNGNRHNAGEVDRSGNFEQEGIYVGLVGTRFEKKNYMEWQHMVISPEQNQEKHGYGLQADQKNPRTKLLALWANFYSQGKQNYFPTYEEAMSDKNDKYRPLKGGQVLLNVDAFKKRLRLIIDPFLLDANQRAAANNKQAYVHAVGLGLGAWQLDADVQAKLMIDVYAEIIADHHLPNISDLDFSFFPNTATECATKKNGENLELNGNNIKIHFSKRNPADKLVGEHQGKLVVAMYAWDSNSFPGNEYWANKLTDSGDPAAACCSLIAQLQNPLVNTCVSGSNTHYYAENNKKVTSQVSKFFINAQDLKIDAMEKLTLAEIKPIQVKNLSQSIGATASLLIPGNLTEEKARQGKGIAYINYTSDSKMIMKFPNQEYAQQLVFLLKRDKGFGDSISYKSIDLVNTFGSYKGEVTISGFPAIKKFIEDVCHYHRSWTVNLLHEKFGIKPEVYKEAEQKCTIS